LPTALGQRCTADCPEQRRVFVFFFYGGSNNWSNVNRRCDGIDSFTSSSNDSTSSSIIDDNAVTTDVGTRILFQNDSMKVWEFSMAMGEACPVHRHVHPYMFINLLPSTSQLLAQDGTTPLGPPVVQRVGQVTYVPLPPSQVAIHANRNCGETDFCQVIVEFLEPYMS
jgi:beta-alanine degradation protein BauB